MAEKVYIHELIDILGHNRARYLHHMTANWCPVGREQRNQLCLGVWATLGSTGPWPEVVNMWELDGWDGLAANFAFETGHGRDQDPALAEWWAAAASLRRGGVDRIVVATEWTRGVEELCAAGVRGEVYAHELVTLPPGGSPAFLAALESEGLPATAALGVEPVGAYRVAMADDSEAIVVWALPDWATWVAYERAWEPEGALAGWRSTLLGLGASWKRQLLIDAPLSPLRTGRQPRVEDRRPLEEL
jgi:hypothetical protein